MENSGLPMYEIQFESSAKQASKVNTLVLWKCVMVIRVYIFIRLYIHKTTAVWLHQETERVSSDRLICVRSKQPFSTDSKTAKTQLPSVMHP